MVGNCFVKCAVCGKRTRIRLEIGYLKQHPIVVTCWNCGTSLTGEVNIDQDKIDVKVSFENAEIVEKGSEEEYVMECSGEFPTLKLHKDTNPVDLTPFIRYVTRLKSRKKLIEFKNDIFTLNKTIKNWPKYKRIFDLSEKNTSEKNKKYLVQELKKNIPKIVDPCKTKLEVLRAIHMIEIISFIDTLRKDIISNLSVSESVCSLNLKQLIDLIMYLELHDGYSLKNMQSSIYKIEDEFVGVYQYLIPAYAISFCKKDSFDYETVGSATSDFELVKSFYLDAYETLGNLLILPISLDNIKYRNNFKVCDSQVMHRDQFSLDDFLKLGKGNRYHFSKSNEMYTSYLKCDVSSKLRNAIGHNDVQYDKVSQQITYIPDSKQRANKKSTYLLKFESEAIDMFKSILTISEYLYRIREVDLEIKGLSIN